MDELRISLPISADERVSKRPDPPQAVHAVVSFGGRMTAGGRGAWAGEPAFTPELLDVLAGFIDPLE